MDGFWTGLGAPAVVDWCEPNYAVTYYVAEFWNTMSSGWILLLGLVGFWRARAEEARFRLAFAGLATVGFGSIAFHGTLLRTPQALDELPMVYFGLACAWMVAYRKHEAVRGQKLAAALILYSVLFTLAYTTMEGAFLIFLASYSSVVAYIALRSIWLTWVERAPRLLSALLALAACSFLGALALFWIPEHVLLACDHPLQQLQLHSLWHMGSGGGTYAWILWALADRARCRGEHTELVPHVIPYVRTTESRDAP